jgi:hypothetical protein
VWKPPENFAVERCRDTCEGVHNVGLERQIAPCVFVDETIIVGYNKLARLLKIRNVIARNVEIWMFQIELF